MQTPDVVVLVPGLLGFTRFGGFYYFADRLIAVLRGLLEEPLGYPVPVVPVTTLPTDSLRHRQGSLLQNLAGICEKLSGVEHVHLVGHSTGGVDAQLLACTKSFDGHAWDKKANAVRKKIKSVVTISAPHYGTGLADSRLARWGDNPLRHPTAILPEARTLIDLLLLVPRDLAAAAGFEFAAPNDVIKFMWQIARNRDLIEDLKPERMEAVRARLTSDPEIALNLLRQRHHASRRRDQPERSFLQGHVSAHRGIAQAILRRVPGAHREEEPELDVVSIQPG